MLKTIVKRIINKLLYYKAEYIWANHIRKIYKNLGISDSDTNSDLIQEHQQYWSQLKKNVNPKWFQVYSKITNNPDIHFIPENIYFNIIEEKLNNRTLVPAYSDKNFYELFFDNKEIFPQTIIRKIDGLFYDSNYNFLILQENSFKKLINKFDKFLVKPSTDSGGGRNILLFERKGEYFISNENQKLSLEFLNTQFEDNFIIQNYIKQSDYLAQFNKSSVNTIRIFTYRSVTTDEVIPLHSIIRIGKKGNFLDDQNVGGVACKIHENGKLNEFATDITGRKYFENNGINFANLNEVPKIKEIREYAVILARKNIHARIIGQDFTVNDKGEVKLIELNHLWTGINFFQMNGSPILGKYTNEVVEFCKK